MSLIPTRLLIIKNLVALLEGPLVINGVEADMCGKVYRGRNILGEEAASTANLPCLSIIEAPRPDIAVFAGEGEARADALTLLITGLIEDFEFDPTGVNQRGDAAYFLHAAVEQRMGRIVAKKTASGRPEFPEHFMLGNLITSLATAPPVVRPEGEKLSSRASFFLPVRVGIAGGLWQPYTSVA